MKFKRFIILSHFAILGNKVKKNWQILIFLNYFITKKFEIYGCFY